MYLWPFLFFRRKFSSRFLSSPLHFANDGALVPVLEDILDVIDFCLGVAYTHGGTLLLGFVKLMVRVAGGESFHIKGLVMLSRDGIFFPSALPLHDVVDGLICDRNII